MVWGDLKVRHVQHVTVTILCSVFPSPNGVILSECSAKKKFHNLDLLYFCVTFIFFSSSHSWFDSSFSQHFWCKFCHCVSPSFTFSRFWMFECRVLPEVAPANMVPGLVKWRFGTWLDLTWVAYRKGNGTLFRWFWWLGLTYLQNWSIQRGGASQVFEAFTVSNIYSSLF